MIFEPAKTAGGTKMYLNKKVSLILITGTKERG